MIVPHCYDIHTKANKKQMGESRRAACGRPVGIFRAKVVMKQQISGETNQNKNPLEVRPVASVEDRCIQLHCTYTYTEIPLSICNPRTCYTVLDVPNMGQGGLRIPLYRSVRRRPNMNRTNLGKERYEYLVCSVCPGIEKGSIVYACAYIIKSNVITFYSRFFLTNSTFLYFFYLKPIYE